MGMFRPPQLTGIWVFNVGIFRPPQSNAALTTTIEGSCQLIVNGAPIGPPFDLREHDMVPYKWARAVVAQKGCDSEVGV